MSENICILVADDHPLFRKGVFIRLLRNRTSGSSLSQPSGSSPDYITNILHKLHVRSRVEAAMLAARGTRGNTIE